MPVLANSTPEPLLGEIVTERVKSELVDAGRWRIANTGQGPEWVLNGTISRLKVNPVAFDADNLATEYLMEIHADFSLVRAADDSTIWSAPDLIGLADFYVDKNSVSSSRESKERAFQDAGQRLAESVVHQLELVPDSPEAVPAAAGGASPATPGGPPSTSPPVAPEAK